MPAVVPASNLVQGVSSPGPDTSGGCLRSWAPAKVASTLPGPPFPRNTQGNTLGSLSGRPKAMVARAPRRPQAAGAGSFPVPGPQTGAARGRRGRGGRAGALARRRYDQGYPSTPPWCNNLGSSSSSSFGTERSPVAVTSSATSLLALRCSERAGEGAAPWPQRWVPDQAMEAPGGVGGGVQPARLDREERVRESDLGHLAWRLWPAPGALSMPPFLTQRKGCGGDCKREVRRPRQHARRFGVRQGVASYR